jgi:hypothetical protein
MANTPSERTITGMRRRPLTLIATAMVFVMAAGVGIFAFTQSQGSAPVTVAGNWSASIAACVPDVEIRNGTTYDAAGARGCLVDVMASAYRQGDTGTFSDALQTAVDNDQALYDVCHNAAHDAGLQALKDLVDPVTALEAVAQSTVCDWGMGHGVMDSLSEQNPSNETFANVTAWCDEREDDMRLYGLCTDGLGHLAWGATKAFDASIQLCETVGSVEGRKACGGGILMQVFAPAAHEAAIPLDEAPARMPALCEQWEKLVTADGALQGCYAGAAYLYSLALKDRMYDWWNAPDYRTGVDIPADRRSRINTAISEALEGCARFPQQGRQACEVALANNIPTRFGAEHVVEHAQNCRLFSDTLAVRICNEVGQRRQQ